MQPVGQVKTFGFSMAQNQARMLASKSFPAARTLDMLRKMVSGAYTYSPEALQAMQDPIQKLITHSNSEIASLAQQAYNKFFKPATPPPLPKPPVTPPPTPPPPPPADSGEAIALMTASISGGREGALDGAFEEIPSAAGVTGRVGRLSNEDGVLLARIDGTTLLAVADGMGGHEKGEVASKLILDALETDFDRDFDIRAAIARAHDEIRQIPRQHSADAVGTTIAVAMIQGDELTARHYGDSRIYVYHTESDELELVTIDDNGAAYQHFHEARKSGDSLNEAGIAELDAAIQAARLTGGANLMAAVGVAIPDDFSEVRTTLQKGDIVLGVSDGGIIPAADIKQVLSRLQTDSPLEIARGVQHAAFAVMETNGLERAAIIW